MDVWRKEVRFADMEFHTGKMKELQQSPQRNHCSFLIAGLYLSSFYPDMDPSALHENQDVAFKCCPNQNTAGKMKEGKAGQPYIPSQIPHFCPNVLNSVCVTKGE